MPLPSTALLRKARIAAWVVLLGCIAGIAFLSSEESRVILVLISLLDIVVLAILEARIRRRLAATLPEVPERSLAFVVITVLSWAIIDSFLFGQGVISVVLCIAGVLYFLPRAIAVRRDETRFKLRLSKAIITTVAGLAAMGIIVYGNVMARERAEKLIAAIEQYHAKHGRYPKRLEEVAPVFIPEIPVAKYVLIADKFSYFVSDSRHSLMYVFAPPFGRHIYTFEERKWTTLD